MFCHILAIATLPAICLSRMPSFAQNANETERATTSILAPTAFSTKPLLGWAE
jgi:hypothetical protein